MFDEAPDVLLQLAEGMKECANFGVCLDYAHASISKTAAQEWMKTLAPYIRHMHINDNDLKNDLNKVMKEGIYIEAVSVVPEGADAAMAAVAAADYRVVIKNDDRITNGDIKDFLAKDEIMVLKEGKKKTALCNIKEGILELKLLDNNVILMKLASGSVMNVKPIQVLAALSEFCGSSFAAESISRLEIYKNIEGKFYPLGDFSHS